MATPMVRPVAGVVLAGESIAGALGDVSLDATRIPYAVATVELPLVDVEVIESIDPREDQRCVITASANVTDEREFDLCLRMREVDHASRVIRVELASDEALLMDHKPLTVDGGARVHESSLRAVVDYVLDKIGAELEPGPDDADVTAYWRVTNLAPNSGVRDTITGYAAGTGTSGVVRSTSVTLDGLPSAQFTASGTGEAYLNTPIKNIRVTPGRKYTFHYRSITSGTPQSMRCMIRWKDTAGNNIGVSYSTGVTGATSGWPRFVLTATAPPNAATAEAFANAVTNSAGQNHFATEFMFYEGEEIVPWFDGASTVTGYTVAYDDPDQPDASTSTRVPDVERLPEVFTWKPGVSAWQFLEPFTTSAGLRLFCDEQRRWWLVNPDTFAADGLLSVAGWNSTAGTDRISREDLTLFCTGVVVHYKWRDEAGIEQEAYDTAGTPGAVLVWEYERPYPGPGAAAAILARRAGRGRAQEVTALANWNATPGMQVSVSLPGTNDQYGRLQAVSWGLADGLMRVRTLELTDAAADSWLGTDPDLDWDDVDADTDWDDWQEG